MLHLILFSVFAAIAAAGALNLLIQRHPISSALSLIVVMGSLAVEYLLLGAEFVAAIQVIIYAGAIMVLFVFVIMLLNAGVEERTKGSKVALIIGFPAMLAIGLLVAWVLVRAPNIGSVNVGAMYGPPKAIGWLLFHDFLLPFEVTSVLVLIAIMGAVVLASPVRSRFSRPQPEPERQSAKFAAASESAPQEETVTARRSN
ncbi:MAG TPA: NADH-quinone oxidoreductase subunit J [Terriglobales bacterium]|nr:NADH-quinone oxidoreductase subunit J [Terriglobales bacterium]